MVCSFPGVIPQRGIRFAAFQKIRNVTPRFFSVFTDENAGRSLPRTIFSSGEDPNRGVRCCNGCPGCPSAKAPRAGGLGRAAAPLYWAAARGERRKAPAVHSPAMVWKAKDHRPFGWWSSVFVSGPHPCAAFHATSIARSTVQKRPNFSGVHIPPHTFRPCLLFGHVFLQQFPVSFVLQDLIQGGVVVVEHIGPAHV